MTLRHLSSILSNLGKEPDMRSLLRQEREKLRQYLRVELDLEALTGHAERMILVGGQDSQDQMTYQPNRVLAGQLDLTVVDFPGGHLGFLSSPAEFAQVLMNALKNV